MMEDNFLFRKGEQLNKKDRSLKQGWDNKIASLCKKIDSSKNYYTTSSCSGRVILFYDKKEKRDDVFIKVWHEEITLKEIKKALKDVKRNKSKEMVYLKHEPCILHVACRDLQHAQKMYDLAKLSGWKRSGIIASEKRYVVELNSTQKLEVPVINKGKLLVSDEFLRVFVKEANKKLKISWENIRRLKESFVVE